MWKLITCASLLLVACKPSPERGFRLPPGDAKAGKAKFAELGCSTCHGVRGVSDLPKPTANPPVPIDLGGRIAGVPTDGQLVTSIIHPSHRIQYKGHIEGDANAELSRMGDYSQVMHVRDLVDIVTFLQTTYAQKFPPMGP